MDEHELLRKLLWPLAFTSVISSMAGISLMLRNNETVRPRDCVMAILASITAAAIVYLLLAGHLEEHPYLLYGISCLAGAGGVSTLDLLFIVARKQLSKRGLVEDPKPTETRVSEED